VCRGDGRVEVLAADATGTVPTVRFTRSIGMHKDSSFYYINKTCAFCTGESIRGLDCGVVNTVDYNEVVVSAFSGKVISFTTEPLNQRASVSITTQISVANNANYFYGRMIRMAEVSKQ
jgi:hypothetical protein